MTSTRNMTLPVCQLKQKEIQEYTGIYSRHWELQFIIVKLSKRVLGINFVSTEHWYPVFSEEEKLLVHTNDDLHNRHNRQNLLIRFSGIASEKGDYGHKGYCHRQVFVRKIHELQKVTCEAGENETLP